MDNQIRDAQEEQERREAADADPRPRHPPETPPQQVVVQNTQDGGGGGNGSRCGGRGCHGGHRPGRHLVVRLRPGYGRRRHHRPHDATGAIRAGRVRPTGVLALDRANSYRCDPGRGVAAVLSISVLVGSTLEVDRLGAQPLVLVADDEPRITKLVAIALSEEGFRVVTAGGGEEAIAAAEEYRPDIVLLDIVMPDRDGIEVMRELQQRQPVPVILLTARGSTSDKAKGLDLGADDYIAKPFHPDELAARVRAVLRRAAGVAPQQGIIRFDDIEIDLERRMVHKDGQLVHLSRTEWLLLQHLASNAGKVVVHSELLTKVWGPEYRDDVQYLRVWISRVRRKLGSEPGDMGRIKTFQGIGYLLDVEPPTEAMAAVGGEPRKPADAPATASEDPAQRQRLTPGIRSACDRRWRISRTTSSAAGSPTRLRGHAQQIAGLPIAPTDDPSPRTPGSSERDCPTRRACPPRARCRRGGHARPGAVRGTGPPTPRMAAPRSPAADQPIRTRRPVPLRSDVHGRPGQPILDSLPFCRRGQPRLGRGQAAGEGGLYPRDHHLPSRRSPRRMGRSGPRGHDPPGERACRATGRERGCWRWRQAHDREDQHRRGCASRDVNACLADGVSRSRASSS